MERLKSYKNIWEVEFHKLFSSGRKTWVLFLAVLFFVAMPWLTLRNFEENFGFFKWHYLDESYLNFVIYKTASKFTWLMIITIPWLYQLLLGEERRRFLKRSNKIFTWLIYTKAWFYAAIGFILIAVSWISSYILYRYWCGNHGIEVEPNALLSMISPAAQLFLRYLAVFPLIIALFLSFPKNSSYLTLMMILLFSAFFIFRIPFHFHYNIHRVASNWQDTFQALIAGLIIAGGLVVYYRFISTKVYVYP